MSEERKDDKRERKPSVSLAGCLVSIFAILVVILLILLLWPSIKALLNIFVLQMRMLLSWLQQYR
jgi:Flp pilus assembly protein TadB